MSSTVNDNHIDIIDDTNDAIDDTNDTIDAIDDVIDTADDAIDATIDDAAVAAVRHSIDATIDSAIDATDEDGFEYMLSTIDNPYDYFDNFNEWYMYDSEKNYNSCSLLARIAKIKNDMTQKEIDKEISRAIDSIIVNDFLGIRIKIKRKRD